MTPGRSSERILAKLLNRGRDRYGRSPALTVTWQSDGVTETEPAATRVLHPPVGYRLTASVRALTFSPYDPCARVAAGTFWWATRTLTVRPRSRYDRLAASCSPRGTGPARSTSSPAPTRSPGCATT